jgi:hypothetical protein
MKCWPKAGKIERKLFRIISLIFKNHPHLVDFLFDSKVPKIRLQSEKLLSESEDLSAFEDLLVRVALDVWGGGGNARIWELLEFLDENNFKNVLKALLKLRPKHRRGWQGPVYRQLKWDSLSSEEVSQF